MKMDYLGGSEGAALDLAQFNARSKRVRGYFCFRIRTSKACDALAGRARRRCRFANSIGPSLSKGRE